MRALLISVATLAAFAAGPALAQQDHAGHHPPTAETPPEASASTEAAAMHEKCKAVMASQMAAKQPHDHGRDKTGAATWPQGKKLSPEEMETLHKQCETMMSKDAAPAPK